MGMTKQARQERLERKAQLEDIIVLETVEELRLSVLAHKQKERDNKNNTGMPIRSDKAIEIGKQIHACQERRDDAGWELYEMLRKEGSVSTTRGRIK